jgi:deoxyribodipyrimidine photo-lyase
LSWGNISVKQAYQFINNATKGVKNKSSFANMLTRLKWHCHFIQKFEVDCSYETKCINAGYELLEHSKNIEYINAWKEARTGFPLIDACMKCLQETGWINFRMRAMLVSFFCHHLYQDWRDATYHLAQLFLDYEPGIHFNQFQMQAGTTGINTIRMYNPIKQSLEHDPEGIFIKKWLPELRPLPKELLHEPYKMSLMEQEMLGVIIGKDYPYPIVDIINAAKEARKNIWGHKTHALVRQENKRILLTHRMYIYFRFHI